MSAKRFPCAPRRSRYCSGWGLHDGRALHGGRALHDGWASFGGWVILAGALQACTASGPVDEPVPPSTTAQPTTDSSPSATASTVATPPSATPPSASASTALAPPPAPAGHDGPLATFHDALRALEKKQRTEHVRVVWLGDSHAQADFWPDAIRKGLQKRFGNGGLGFVHFGMKNYRHAGIKLDIKGGWRMRPKMPSTVDPWGDGAFGLGGILHAGFRGYRAVTLNVTDDRLEGKKLALDLCYKPGLAADRFDIEIGTDKKSFEPGKDAVGKITHASFNAAGKARIRARIQDGRPDFCGLVIETDPSEGAGVVLDNLGINGARYATPLAWNEAAWGQEVKRRLPEMFIFEYGGNEASDGIVKPKAYKKDALALIARARRIAPNASCFMIGPSDRTDAEQRIPPIVDALEEAAKEAKCFFWNTYAVMGGRGSTGKWKNDGRAAPDGIHLTPTGYAEVGALMLQDLLADYRP